MTLGGGRQAAGGAGRRQATASPGGRAQGLTGVLLLAAVLLGGCGGLGEAPARAYQSAVDYFDRWAAEREPPQPRVADGLRDYRPARSVPVPRPTRVELPSVGISSDLERLGLDADGVIQAPSRWETAGWFRGGPRPGEQGPAVILGHVDSTSGPAVFYRLRDVERGDRVRVTRADGSVAVFEVDRMEQHPKARFPTADVYFPTLEPSLRLVTCGGDFDRSAGSYRDNLVVFATLVR